HGWCQGAGDFVPARRRDGQAATRADAAAPLGGGEAREHFPGAVGEEKAALAIEKEQGFAAALEQGLPAELLGCSHWRTGSSPCPVGGEGRVMAYGFSVASTNSTTTTMNRKPASRHTQRRASR